MATTKEIFENIHETLSADPSRTGGLQAVYQFHLTGDDGGTYHIVLTPDSASASEGEAEAYDCKLEMSAANFKDLVAGKLNGAAAFMTGKIRVEGKIGLAMKLQSVLSAYSS